MWFSLRSPHEKSTNSALILFQANPNATRRNWRDGHISWLIHQNVDFIFYPAIPYERNEFPDANNHYNCPIVTSYSENIKNNVEEITSGQMRFLNPFMAFTNEEVLSKQLVDCFKKEFHIPEAEVRDAVSEGWKELAMTRLEMQKKGEEVLKYMEEHHRRGIVLAGRPYHVDPEINHGIPEMITSYGMCVLTEDSISHLGIWNARLLSWISGCTTAGCTPPQTTLRPGMIWVSSS